MDSNYSTVPLPLFSNTVCLLCGAIVGAVAIHDSFHLALDPDDDGDIDVVTDTTDTDYDGM